MDRNPPHEDEACTCHACRSYNVSRRAKEQRIVDMANLMAKTAPRLDEPVTEFIKGDEYRLALPGGVEREEIVVHCVVLGVDPHAGLITMESE